LLFGNNYVAPASVAMPAVTLIEPI